MRTDFRKSERRGPLFDDQFQGVEPLSRVRTESPHRRSSLRAGPQRCVSASLERLVSVAPMMDRTDRHERYLLRLISRRTLLYTEMIPVGTVLFGDRDRHLAFNSFELPVALQLGGSDPGQLALCARWGEQWGYREINLNVGCPSSRVRSGRFGACLMAHPQLVAECVAAMSQAVHIPVTVKCRIGIDQRDTLEQLCEFIRIVAGAGCDIFIIHARKAWLNGLSPKRNRTVPPLRHEVVHQIKREFADLSIVINGGITSLDEAASHLKSVDGVMIGREAYGNPYLLASVDRRFYQDHRPVPDRYTVLHEYLEYCGRQLTGGCPLPRLTRHLHGLFHGLPGAKAWRRCLSERTAHTGSGTAAIAEIAVAARSLLEEASRRGFNA